MAITLNGSTGITLPSGGTADTAGAVVGTTDTQTLTNKTFGSGTVLTSTPSTTTAQSMVRLNTANGYGSTNTQIKRYSTVVTNQGSDITYADSATLGASFTINTNGVYAISCDGNSGSVATVGASINSTQLTTSINTITAADRLTHAQVTNANCNACWVGYLPAGSVIRSHAGGAYTPSNASSEQFTIARVA